MKFTSEGRLPEDAGCALDRDLTHYRSVIVSKCLSGEDEAG